MKLHPPKSPLFPYTTLFRSIELPNPKLELRPGMYAIVKIGIERKEDALLVPVEALVTERARSEEHTSELQSHSDLVCRLLLEKKKKTEISMHICTQPICTSV